MVKEELDELDEVDEVGKEEGDGDGARVGVGDGVEVDKVNTQTLLQSLHMPEVSFAFTLQYQVPEVS